MQYIRNGVFAQVGGATWRSAKIAKKSDSRRKIRRFTVFHPHLNLLGLIAHVHRPTAAAPLTPLPKIATRYEDIGANTCYLVSSGLLEIAFLTAGGI